MLFCDEGTDIKCVCVCVRACSGSPMVTVQVHHPPEAMVKIHQVVKVTSGSETVVRSSGISGSHGHSATFVADRTEATPARVQAQTFRGDSIYTEASGFKYCFREVRNGQVRNTHQTDANHTCTAPPHAANQASV